MFTTANEVVFRLDIAGFSYDLQVLEFQAREALNRPLPRERKDAISDEVASSLRIVETGPDRLVLCLQYPLDPESEYTPASEILELTACIQTLNANGEWVSRNRVIRLNPRGEGRFPALPAQSVTERPPMLLVETHLLEMADHAHQDR
ncbi:hypothetical protein ACQKP7_04575 [Pseudomonas frederiksbergensis]|uniref:hypothetical protein n=1 Tax=Pseudomonas frederiksbergensis TaxID=104087 RepID=UPI003D081852